MHGNLGMKTRRKHAAARNPGGRLSEAGKPKEHAPTHVKRLRDAALRMMADPEWGSELGRLYLEQTITPEMYAAGKTWREKSAKYGLAIGSYGIRSAQLEAGRKGSPPDPDSLEGRKQAIRERNAMEKFFEAHYRLIQAGRLAESVVRRLCEHDEGPCGMAELIALRNGLSALAEG